jgi:hypothetical protein
MATMVVIGRPGAGIFLTADQVVEGLSRVRIE